MLSPQKVLSPKCSSLRKVLSSKCSSFKKYALPLFFFYFPLISGPCKVLSLQKSALPKLLSPQKVLSPKCSPQRKVLSSKCSPLKKCSPQSALPSKSALLKVLSPKKVLSLKCSPHVFQGESVRRHYGPDHAVVLQIKATTARVIKFFSSESS